MVSFSNPGSEPVEWLKKPTDLNGEKLPPVTDCCVLCVVGVYGPRVYIWEKKFHGYQLRYCRQMTLRRHQINKGQSS